MTFQKELTPMHRGDSESIIPQAANNNEAFNSAFPPTGPIYQELKADKTVEAQEVTATAEASHKSFMDFFHKNPEAAQEIKSEVVKQYRDSVVTDTTHIILDEAGWKATVAANENHAEERLAA